MSPKAKNLLTMVNAGGDPLPVLADLEDRDALEVAIEVLVYISAHNQKQINRRVGKS
jgi:hypothetical protein